MRDGKLPEWSTEIAALKTAADGVNQIVNRVNSIDSALGAQGLLESYSGAGTATRPSVPAFTRGVLCKITSSLGNGNYTGRRFVGSPQYVSGSASVPGATMTDPGSDNVLVVNLGEAPFGAPLAINSWVTGMVVGTATLASGAPVPLVVCGPTQAALVPVLVQQNGGAAGTSTTTVSATYNIYSLADTGMTTPLNGGSSPTPLSPLMNRTLISPANVAIAVAAAGSVGIACFASGGAQLLWVQETPTWGC